MGVWQQGANILQSLKMEKVGRGYDLPKNIHALLYTPSGFDISKHGKDKIGIHKM